MIGTGKRIMSNSISACWPLIAISLIVSACADTPPDYSPDYYAVAKVNRNRVTYTPAPKACFTPDDTANDDLGEHIPPGCANAYNLQRMVERDQDLFEGRKLGKAPAEPSVRAAQKYLNGGVEPPLNGATVDTPRPATVSPAPSAPSSDTSGK
jgi:hypothetical protein